MTWWGYIYMVMEEMRASRTTRARNSDNIESPSVARSFVLAQLRLVAIRVSRSSLTVVKSSTEYTRPWRKELTQERAMRAARKPKSR
jgi:hypothetical protein